MLATWGTSTGRNPTLDLQFAGATSLDDRITFSRGSQATLFDSAGALVYAKHNLLLQSQTFDNASWTKTRSSITQDTAIAPDGTTTADSLVEDGTASNTHDLRQAVTNTGTNTWTLSVYLKAVNRPWGLLEIQNATATSNRARAWFDLQNGVVGTGNTAGSGVTYVSHSIQNVGNGWYRCILVGTADSAVTSVQAWLEGTTADSVAGYNGVNGQTSVYVWGAQLNFTAMEGGVTSSLSTYYPTVASAYYAPRFDYSPSTLAAQGLLIEEQRTNSIRNNTMQGAVAGTPGTLPTNWGTGTNASGLAWSVIGTGTESGITYIDLRLSGTATSATEAFVFFESTTGAAALNGQTWTNSSYIYRVSGSITNITSLFCRATSRISAGAAGSWTVNGASVLTAANSATSLSTVRATVTGTISDVNALYVWPLLVVAHNIGAIDITLRIGLPQLEQGAFATSVIPTTTTALTRNADVASMTGTNFSSWFNAAAGTLSITASTFGSATTNRRIAFMTDGTTSNRIGLLFNSSNRGQFLVVSSGSIVANPENTVVAITSPSRIAAAYALDDYAMSINGAAVVTDNSGALPSGVNQMSIGSQLSNEFVNGYIQRISFWPVRLANSQLQALTS